MLEREGSQNIPLFGLLPGQPNRHAVSNPIPLHDTCCVFSYRLTKKSPNGDNLGCPFHALDSEHRGKGGVGVQVSVADHTYRKRETLGSPHNVRDDLRNQDVQP